MPFILGSRSPRRVEILNFFNFPFTQVNPNFNEKAVPFSGNPQDYVTALAQGKADSLEAYNEDSIILTADTIVYKEGKIYGKPEDQDEASRFLKELAGQWHSVFTGLCLRYKGKNFQSVEETRVLFNSLTNEQILSYIQTLHLTDKAGAYFIQGAGGIIVKKIEGCYYNVVGLPINALHELLKDAGIDLWNHLKNSY